MSKLYVPNGVWLACDKGTSPSTLRVSNHVNTSIYAQEMATEADKLPFFNIKPMGLCAMKGGMCTPMPLGWEKVKEGVKINGNRMLLEDSTCKCLLTGEITIHFDKASAIAAGMGNGKMPSEYIKDGFDYLEKQRADAEKIRESILPDWMEGVADVGDWFGELNTGLVEGAINGVVGLGETIYQVAQDPVGTAEAVGGMIEKGYNATVDGVSKAADWASDGKNWENAANGAYDWASDGNNWKQAASDTWEGTKKAGKWVAENPRKIGNVAGEFIPDAVAAAYTGGGSLALTGAKKVVKEGLEEAVEETLEKGIKNKLDDIAEAGLRSADDVMEQLAKGADGDIAKVLTKSADDIAKEIEEKIAKHLEDAKSKFDADNATSKQKGNFGEMASADNMVNNPSLKEKGYDLRRIGDDSPSTLDDKLKRGIDGIYENATPPPKYVIDEAKFGKSELNPNTKDGKQMSDDWINGNNRLENQVGKDKADEIRDAMENGEVEKVISKVDKNGNVTTSKVDANGNIGDIWP
jgi:hypothetical protein